MNMHGSACIGGRMHACVYMYVHRCVCVYACLPVWGTCLTSTKHTVLYTKIFVYS
jgi:hypothetical protein